MRVLCVWADAQRTRHTLVDGMAHSMCVVSVCVPAVYVSVWVGEGRERGEGFREGLEGGRRGGSFREESSRGDACLDDAVARWRMRWCVGCSRGMHARDARVGSPRMVMARVLRRMRAWRMIRARPGM